MAAAKDDKLKNPRAARLGRWGVSIVEVIVSLMVFSTAVLALTSAGVISGKQMKIGRSDVQLWAAVHHKLDALSALEYDEIQPGSDTVFGYPMTWAVQGAKPKKIILTVQVPNRLGVAVPDTFVTYRADWE